MHSSDILNDTISIESIASHYFNVISACERLWINRFETGVLCLWIKKQQNPTAGFLYPVPPVFLETDLEVLLWQTDSLAIAAYSEEHTNKKTALVTMAVLKHEYWPITFLMIYCNSIQVLSSCFRPGLGIKNSIVES